MTSPSAPLVVWSLPGSRSTIRVFGATGFGPPVEEVAELEWTKVTGKLFWHVRLVGEPGPARSATVAALVDAYRVRFTDGPVEWVRTVDDVRDLDALLDRMPSTGRGARPEGPLQLLVVDPAEPFDTDAEAVIARASWMGGEAGWSFLFVSDTALPNTWDRAYSASEVVVFVVEDVHPFPEVGHRLERALRGDVRTAAGVASVLTGSPPEWVRSFESAEVSDPGGRRP